jgi:hypothetical protein
MYLDVVLQPTDVSSCKVQIMEPEAKATNKLGFFTNCVPPPPDHKKAQGAGAWLQVHESNRVLGPPSNHFDEAWSGGWPTNKNGSYEWSINPIWRVGAGDKTTHRLQGWTSQQHELQKGGVVVVKKLGWKVTRHPLQTDGIVARGQ